MQGSILRRREPGQWYLLVKSIANCNGYGDPIDPIDASHAGRITQRCGITALRPDPHNRVLRRPRILPGLRLPYCHQHWHRPDRAERTVQPITGDYWKAMALARIAGTLAVTDPDH